MSRTTLFRQLVQQRHLTTHASFSAQFARSAHELAEREGDPRLARVEISSRQFDRWMGGELRTLPRPDPCRILEHMLGHPAARLFSVPAKPPAGPSPPPSAPTGSGGENPLDIVARARQLVSGNADDATLAFVGSSLEQVVNRYEQDGPLGLHAQASSLRGLLHALLEGRQPPAARQELFRLTARAAGLLGYMSVNTGKFALAEAYCTEAQELSQAIGDQDTELWACGTRSLALYYDGRYAEADACAAAAADRAPRSEQLIRLLANGRARALAKIGDAEGARRAIGQALALSDMHDVPQGITPCISFEPYGNARTLANAVTAHVALGSIDHVLRNAAAIDDLVESSDSAWSRSLVRLDVASALLQQPSPDLEQALTLGTEALRLCGDTPIRSVLQRSRDLRDQAQQWRTHPAAREYEEELRAWRSQPAALAMS
ncbi:hypothetical protein GCM10009716_47530 [Streptomyces sodiiphilus]|uniref:Transcriptional regulator n=1 Tax=Streptomyces sodiiphilus TaxID=226217 RepID=A0ABN2PVI3_9ACTN